MPPGCLTVLAPIRSGAETALRGTLRAIGDDINGRRLAADPGRPHVDFARSQRIHFARFAILDDPDRGPGRRRLLYASVYDGALADHLAELVDVTSDLDAIWSACVGYAGAATFHTFISEHAHQPEAYYIAFRDETVASIRHAISVRQHATSLTPPPAAVSLTLSPARCNGWFGQRRSRWTWRERWDDSDSGTSMRGQAGSPRASIGIR